MGHFNIVNISCLSPMDHTVELNEFIIQILGSLAPQSVFAVSEMVGWSAPKLMTSQDE